ncbi:hypothetical protein [Kitasatospora terrestris]|uniref:LysR substrate-binding domain-containing protein n=1 Tax=Kitasatospora terrestris TaxID=258051 RepID=A0ABP9ERH9_9ACTN
MLYSTIDLAGDSVRAKLSALGATPRPGPTIEATLRIAHRRGAAALVPLLAARWWADPTSQVLPSPVPGQVTVSLITRPPQPAVLTGALPAIARGILGEDRP